MSLLNKMEECKSKEVIKIRIGKELYKLVEEVCNSIDLNPQKNEFTVLLNPTNAELLDDILKKHIKSCITVK